MLKRKYLFLVLAFVMIIGMLSIPTAHGAYTLVWSDEFDGSSLNTSNWTCEIGGGGWGNNELQYYRAENATVSGGVLTITAKRESYGGYAYTSARLKTQNKRTWTYGRVEARLLVPKGQGLWPAFWMLGNNISSVSWPACGEIDIMEHVNTNDTLIGTIHWDSGGHAYYGGETGVSNMATWHVYSVEWTPSYIRWFVDGRQYWEANIANSINSTEEFHRPFFILLNLAVGGNWPGSPNSGTPFPAEYKIDYVRVYQDGGGGGNPTPTPQPPPSNGVTFYQDINYGGTARTLGAGNYTLSQLNAAGIPNDWMSSLRVPSGYTVVVYEHDNFAGNTWTFTADTSFVGSACNDKMSSCRITTGGGSGSGYTYGVTNVSSNQARFWFKPSGWTSGYVILHYTMSGAGQQNVNMTYNSGAGQWEYTAGGLVSGRSITYNFTYNRDGLQYDSPNATWTKP